MIISRKTTLLLLLFIFASLSSSFARKKKTTKIITTPVEVRVSREEYINRYKEIAIDHQRRFKIPASITMAQGILESDCGNSRLARASNNHFGIKCKSGWKGLSVRHDDDAPNECFRAYHRVEESYEDHARFLDQSPRYDSLFRFDPTDYRSWARGLKGAGYATAPDYTHRLIRIIEESNLHELDMIASGGVRSANVKTNTPILTPRNDNDLKIMRADEGINPNSFQISVNNVNGYNLYKCNQTLFIVTKDGDSYQSVAKRFSLSTSTLCSYNDEPNRNATLSSGDYVYIEQKGKSWIGNDATHTISQGETYRKLSQLYGIRESSLRKINKCKRGEPTPGSTIRLRK